MRKRILKLVFWITLVGALGIGLLLVFGPDTGGYGSNAVMVLSAESGFYEEPFDLTIQSPANVFVYYTLDGSAPTEASTRYTGPVRILPGGTEGVSSFAVPNAVSDWQNAGAEVHDMAAAVLRAVALDADGTVIDEKTATYFVGPTGFEDKIIISLVADPEDLFGKNGIYVTGEEYDAWYLGDRSGAAPVPNYLKRGKEWERQAVMELFQEGESLLQQSVGLRLQGASAREGKNKRFSVYARKEYGGSGWFQIPLFGEKRTHSLMLRSGFMNGYIQHLVQDRDVASAESREVIVYLNGAMWYITIAQEKYSEKYFQEHFGIPEDNVVIVKAGVAESGDAGDQLLYREIYDFLGTHDMTRDDAYDQLDEVMDIQSYIDFSCVNIYFGNLDYSEYKNIICWRAREPGYGEYEDGRWRWALYDLDLENLNYGYLPEDINTFTLDTHFAGSAFNTRTMWVALVKNERFREQFAISFMDMVNTDFTLERAARAVDDWGVTMGWWGMQEDWAETYFPARTRAVTGYMAEELGLKGTEERVTLSVNDDEAGYVRLNTIVPDLSEGEWSGSYFTDYPITVTAVPREGHRFVGWEIGGGLETEELKQKTLTVEIPIGGLKIKAIFK